MKRGFLGGTFNPPHLGHIRAAKAAMEQLGLDELYFIPTGEPPHKSLPEVTATAEQRLEMTCLAAAEVPNARALDLEIRREGPSYSVLTARELLEEDPEGELWLLCGTDMFLTLDRWYRADWLLKNLHIAAYPRKPGEIPDLEEKAEVLRRRWDARVELILLDPLEISSTDVRMALKRGGGSAMLCDGIYAYILRSRLYSVLPEPDGLWRLARPMLEEKRIPHVMGCREEARRLARRWGADADEAERAAILHDVTKKLPIEEQLRLCSAYGIIPGIGAETQTGAAAVAASPEEFAQRYPAVLHAFSGAAIAWGEFGISPAVRDAVMWHTTGKRDMTLLEKIIWLADYIEPTRTMPGVKKVRRLAYEDLDDALRLAMRNSLDHMAERKKSPHPASLEALNDLMEKER